MASSNVPPSVQEAVDASGWCAQTYNTTASFVYSAAFTAPVLDLLNAQPGENIIDFGCGSGEVSQVIQDQVGAEGLVVGVDASESMVEKASKNGVRHTFVVDLQVPFQDFFPESYTGQRKNFDAVFSNATFHWCKRDPLAVLGNAAKVLKKGGRLVVEMGGWGNCFGVRGALHYVLRARGHDPAALDPWFFPSPEEYAQLLKSAGFTPSHISLVPRHTPLNPTATHPTPLHAWLHLFSRHAFLGSLSDEEANAIFDEVVKICEVDCKTGIGAQERWALLYVRLRFVAILDS